MYDLKQFRPTLYVLLFIGFTGFAVAAESATLWVLSVGLLALNAWLVFTNRFAPLPRWIANIVTVLSLLYVADRVASAGSNAPILVIGQFLVLLQLVKIYEQRANRDFAQLLVLSLLLMVAASISTASLTYGLMLIGYLFLSLYCCLLFHLKVESELAKEALAETAQKYNPATLRQDQRYLSRSMRRLTGLVSGVAVATAVIVFLFFPRGSGGNLIGPLRMKPAQTLTGFSDQVSFEQVARITQSDERVALVTVEHNGVPVDGSEILLLRGNALDVYGGASPDSPSGAWRWTRSRRPSLPAIGIVQRTPSDLFSGERVNNPTDVWTQHVKLKPTGTKILFALAGPIRFKSTRDVNLVYTPGDEVIQSREPLYQDIEYWVTSDGSTRASEDAPDPADGSTIDAAASGDDPPATPAKSVIDPKIGDYAMKPEVCGVDPATGQPLAAIRPKGRVSPLDAEIAANIANHLQSKFSYTLDLTDAAKIIKGQDPLVAFLYDLKRGHCEYFAGAMALMCQSIGMQARVIVGFKCDDYNALGKYYEVRQSHAHAWVEVLTPDGRWRTFDPTSAHDARSTVKPGLVQKIKHFFSYLEFKWAEHVVAYDNDTRENLIQQVETRMGSTATRTSDRAAAVRQWVSDAANVLSVGAQILAGLIILAIVVGLCAIAYFVLERWLLRRRAARIGLEGLPEQDQLRLARQLKFYADLMAALQRRNIVRARHQTPLEFANSLTFLPTEVYDAVHQLTDFFYRIRFGRHDLPAEEHRRLAALVSDVDAHLPSSA